MNDRERLRRAFEHAYLDRAALPGLEDRVFAGLVARRAPDGGAWRLALAAVAVVLLGTLAVAMLLTLGWATGSARPQPASTPPPVASPAPPSPLTPSARGVGAVPPATPSPAATPAGPDCRIEQLSVRWTPAGVALGHAAVQFTFRNTSGASCTLFGFPGLQLLDARGASLPTYVNWGHDYIVQPETPTLVTLPPDGEASFLLGYTDDPGRFGLTCPISTQVAITPPNETRSLVIPFQFAGADPDPVTGRLKCGAFAVSPVYPGTSRFQPLDRLPAPGPS